MKPELDGAGKASESRTSALLVRINSFIDEVIENSFQGRDMDGGEIQEVAERHGLLKITTAYRSCGENCACAKTCGFPTECCKKMY